MAVVFGSCDDFFGEPIEQNITQDTIFNSMVNAEKLLNSVYNQVPYLWPTNWDAGEYDNKSRIHQNILASITDEGISGSTWSGARSFFYGDCQMTPDNVGVLASKGDKRMLEHVFEAPYFYFR
ncbi:MAG: hypothetical protein MI799_01870, partial [Desulfobacterales bacterium]|nr:hypothetical protein [Desulfobacterales bacterium]